MKKYSIIIVVFLIVAQLQAQVEPEAGTWKTWFITSGKDYRLPAPSSYKNEIAEVLEKQKNSDATTKQQIIFWNAGAPGYRWQEMMNKLWAVDTGRYAILANLLLGTAIYDATIAAWDTKYAYKRPRPFIADSRIKVYAVKPESPSYPCEHSVAAGVAVAIFSKFFPKLADSVNRMAQQLMSSRIAAGVAFPSDTRAGFDLGKRIAQKEIEHTKDYVTTAQWDGKVPDKPGLWRGKFAMFPMAGQNKTVVLESGSEFRPGPPPDFAKEMEEMKNYKQNFRSLSNAFYWANQSWFMDNLPKKMFERNLQLNPPRAARINAVVNVASYDAFTACWDAKYAYWGIRPSQYDTTYRPAILMTPPFPGYPSGHAAISGTMAEIYSYFFPDEKELFHQKAKEAAESRFQAGIHFRADNDVALELGKKVAVKVLQRVKADGADAK
ncbi:MAG TPA: vanadium-dependent haloperoxidase [Chitinophagaceae bacterium]|nr:vanadium-dependent haloperoxidase [Chitinophagaceae bacterium]